MKAAAAEYVGTFKQGSPEWHDARAQGIGSSDIAPILGLAGKSAYTLWCEKVGLVAPIQPDEKLQRKFDYGHHMEPFVAGIFGGKHPEYSVQETGSWRNVERPWQLSNPDRLVYLADSPADVPTPHAALELKTFPTLADWEAGPPAGYIAQLLWQVDTFGWQEGFLAGYANLSGDYLEYRFELSSFEADATRARAWLFMQSVTEARQLIKDAEGAGHDWTTVRDSLLELAPDRDGSEGTYQTLRRVLNPSIPDPKAEAEIPAEIAEEYLAACARFKDSESELFRWKGHLLAHTGTAKFAMYNGAKIATRYAPRADAVPTLKEA